MAPEDLKKAYQLGLSNPKAELTIAQIVEKFEFTKEKARNVLNKLVQTRAASPPRNDAGSGDLVVRVREQDLALRLRNLQSVEAYLVFCIVENSGTAGIGSRDLTRGVNDRIQQAGKPPMPPQNLNKALKQLEADKIIKQIKSIHHKGRKMYIVADLEVRRLDSLSSRTREFPLRSRNSVCNDVAIFALLPIFAWCRRTPQW